MPPVQILHFGDFELDVRAGELRRGKLRIRLQEQPFQILLMLLERPGEVVTREEIQARLWPGDTIVEFDHSIGTAIKKLRQALGDEATSPRYVETLPRRVFRFIYPQVVAEPEAEPVVEETAASGPLTSRSEQETAPQSLASSRIALVWRPRLMVTATIAMLCIPVWFGGRVLWNRFAQHRNHGTLDESSLVQVTTSDGLDVNPSLSPDGSSIAYSSDQSGEFEIYVKSLAPGGQQLQLTNDGGGNFSPAWSPDGKQIAYYSAQKGGIWLIPALGGTGHRLTDFGSSPAWSPDGTRIAFQPEQNAGIAPSTIWVVSAQGGPPTQPDLPRSSPHLAIPAAATVRRHGHLTESALHSTLRAPTLVRSGRCLPLVGSQYAWSASPAASIRPMRPTVANCTTP
jgi:DNA-binding winged helix-turn-helix (wHTH) protein